MAENLDSKTTEETKLRRTSREPKPNSKHLGDKVATHLKRSPRRNCKKQLVEEEVDMESEMSDGEGIDSELDRSDE